ncbi:MAG TPA: hypothetical protein PKW35_08525 [Nannocystaceae bacterium]|nr:hypothetical protein [Nannocystaceae bacterium]
MVITVGTSISATAPFGPFCVDDVEFLRVQARGTGFSGQIDISQGESPTAKGLTKSSGALSSYTGSTEYYDLRPSSFVWIDVTVSAGQINELLLAWGKG